MVSPENFPDPATDIVRSASAEGVAVLAGGCFWCVEAVYKQLDGVTAVTSGYAGGSADVADYETVSSGRTDHAEAVEAHFDGFRVIGPAARHCFVVGHIGGAAGVPRGHGGHAVELLVDGLDAPEASAREDGGTLRARGAHDVGGRIGEVLGRDHR